ncbi:hypothetical protein VTN77DRAFT_2484 [Rasamsonia byssochlamydoides]|uniref:uncharacterized protein n=1 Tax=Rasamsonia byssochlamydoides TaxID=89139 RepID=UPI003743391C
MATDTESRRRAEADALPTPSPAPFRTPSRAMSRRRRDSSPGLSLSPPSLPLQHLSPDYDHEHAIDVVNDATISPFDPRRFTPTLHASLVSEILSLRRELENKNKEIDALETTLEDARTENEALNESLAKHTKENRSLKRQMQLLEGGTLTALSDLAKERDDAVENITDVRKRLEQAQKRARSQEEEVERTQMLWDRDKQAWETERRNWERKVHVVENRLKVVLNEVAAAQAAGAYRKHQAGDVDKPRRDSTARESDTASVRSSGAFGRRRASTTSDSTQDGEPFINSGRFSSMSFVNGVKSEGVNLAEELAFDEEDEEDDFTEGPEDLLERRPTSVHSQLSYTMGMKARKILGLSFDGSVDNHGASDVLEQIRSPDQMDFGIEKLTGERQIDYRDVGIQYSPPPSPQLPPQPELLQDDGSVPASILENRPASEEKTEESATVPASRSSQRVDSGTLTTTVDMVSSSCQTVDLPSPPRTPEVAQPASSISQVKMASSSTQTDPVIIKTEEEQKASEAPKEPQPFAVPIPTIAIHPPGSEPSSPRSSVVLPPHTKSVSCQTDLPALKDVRSVSMQTEEIRIDKRPVKLPASLLPSAINDLPTNKPESLEISMPFRSPPPRSPKRGPLKPFSGEAGSKNLKGKQPDRVQAYPGNNDNGPLAENGSSDIRRPFRTSSLFAGFSDEEYPEHGAVSDDELYNRPTLKSEKILPRASLDENPLREVDEPDTQEASASNRSRMGSVRRASRGSKMASSSRQSDIRRAALISNGAAAHQRTRPRSPSDPSIDSAGSGGAARPPFPVPIRLSSRKVPTSASEGAQSPTPYSNGNERSGRRITRQPTLRKVRSAAAIPRANQSERARSRSPPTMSTSSYAPDSPQVPPMPHDEITAPRGKRSARKLPSNRTGSPSIHSNTTREETTPTSIQPTSVVDAIAQTMVGEWMYKYVRRRKSFGMSDAKDTWESGKNTEEVSANITSIGVRHKRWVWLAPYERAVMWSSKQPTSGSALLGKSGRKLIIQSVLDVKDDTPLPKGSGPQSHFNRSILILTPQRALKFTAMSLERHYVWLTALSFLSHSNLGMNDLTAFPPVPQEDFVSAPPTAALRRNPIRDSIKVAKSKPRQQPNAKRSFTAHPAPVPEYGDDMFDPMDAADPPNVPRFSNHSRKRSNTAPRALPSAFRSFSSNATVPSTYSGTTAASSDLYTLSSIGGQSSFSQRTSEASGPSSVGTGNFFDAVGTVRMEAFIDRVDVPRHRGNYHGRHGVRKTDSSQWGSGHHELPDFTRSEDGSDIFYRHDDPFRGF